MTASRYVILGRAELQAAAEYLPPAIAASLLAAARPTAADPAAAEDTAPVNLKLILEPAYLLGVPALRRAVYKLHYGIDAETREVLETVRRYPRGAILNLLLYAQAGAPVLASTAE